ncbi:MAG: NUDIX domain-containing protein [Eudoraea sp.]|nr:NUDIX domain-containing protein [Eudoraea sp.]
MHPIFGVLLFFISVILLLITGPLGLIYGFFYTLFKGGLKGLGEYLLKIAVSIDQLGNVLMQHLLNLLWIKKGGYPFGNRDETISSALGRNKKLGMLTLFGKGIDSFLDTIDPNHSLNSIDYYVEPSENTIDKLAWMHLKDRRILCVRSKGKSLFYLPGGKRDKGESDLKALTREIKEELKVLLDPNSFRFIRVFEAQADGKPPGMLVRMTCYEADYQGELQIDSEIEEMAWLGYHDREKVSEVCKVIFDHLRSEDRM